ncbi:hypothetical protein ElyMa_004337700 [Elysia marginata]|uniref:Uncharacterized protein n=1 Tax=Elysia marginata TaxID=1093978 RepID=A0AAV4H2R1_9GAST|nr:hypothetical protein ElyMa_004337700 [Elysia marginata]
MLDILWKFLRAESTGNWHLQLMAILAAFGYNLYPKEWCEKGVCVADSSAPSTVSAETARQEKVSSKDTADSAGVVTSTVLSFTLTTASPPIASTDIPGSDSVSHSTLEPEAATTAAVNTTSSAPIETPAPPSPNNNIATSEEVSQRTPVTTAYKTTTAPTSTLFDIKNTDTVTLAPTTSGSKRPVMNPFTTFITTEETGSSTSTTATSKETSPPTPTTSKITAVSAKTQTSPFMDSDNANKTKSCINDSDDNREKKNITIYTHTKNFYRHPFESELSIYTIYQTSVDTEAYPSSTLRQYLLSMQTML